MTETAVPPLENSRRFRFDWVLPTLFRPRQTFARIVSQETAVWLTPLVILSLTALLLVFDSGSIKQAAAATGQVSLPENFQYYSPEQQAQFQQAMAATSSPVFLYVFPAILALARVWGGWLVVAGLMHLLLTLFGGRGGTTTALNVVAWASLPFAVRDMVRAAAMWNSHQLIASPGLAGFAPMGDGMISLFLAALMGLLDIYVIWYILLLIFGVRAGNGLSAGKAIAAVLITVLLILLVQALLGVAFSRLGSLTIIRPFF